MTWDMHESTHERTSCTSADDHVAPYCFGDLTEAERYRFEAHLIGCPSCWDEVQRLDAIVRSIRHERNLTRQFDGDIVSLVGISSRMTRPFCGHRAHAVVASAMYALAVAVTVFMEIAYAYSRYASFVWMAAPLVLGWSLLAGLFAVAADARLVRQGRKSGLAAAILILVFSSVLHYLVLRSHLPDRAITQASFQTWTAQAAYLKGLLYCGVFTILFLLTPFHFIVSMQAKLSQGRYQLVHRVLTGGKFAIPPHGAPFLSVWLLGALLIVGASFSVLSTAHLLEALIPTHYASLFIEMIVVRWLLFLALGLECCWWYYSALHDLKRETSMLRLTQ